MNQSADLFSIDELMQFQALVKRQLLASVRVPLNIFMGMLEAAALAVVGVVEWEIVYEVFVYLSGDEQGYWAPELMACTAGIMIIGFHLLAKTKPENLAVRIVEAAVQVLIPVYLIGVGLLIAAIMYADGLGGMVAAGPELVLGALPEVTESGWLDRLYDDIANPLSVLTLSLGIGGLAVINIFVAHRLLTMFGANLSDLVLRISRTREAIKDHAIIRRTQKAYAALALELDELAVRDDAYIRLAIANDVIAVIAEAMLPHKIWLTEHALGTDSRFEGRDQIDIKQITREIARIEAISLKDVLAALNPKHLEGK